MTERIIDPAPDDRADEGIADETEADHEGESSGELGDRRPAIAAHEVAVFVVGVILLVATAVGGVMLLLAS